MKKISTDVVIIGSGTAGLNARRAVLAQGKKVIMLENGPYGAGSRATRVREEALDQLSLFAGSPSSPALDRLDELDVDRMTPLEALNELAELKRLTDADNVEQAHCIARRETAIS